MFKLTTYIALVCLFCANVWADNSRLIVQIAQVPVDARREAVATLQKTAAELPRFLTNPVTPGGVEVNYAGYRYFTNREGRASFVLSYQAKTITIVIAQQVFPVKLSGSTIDHFALFEGEKPAKLEAEMYEMQREKVDDKSWIWTVTAKNLPDDGKIDNKAVIIKASPSSVYVPVGKFTVKQKDHVLLPKIYLLDREGLDQAILTELGQDKLAEQQLSRYNLLQQLRESVEKKVKGSATIEITSVAEEPV